MKFWQLQAAKARMSELVKCAQAEGPQQITVHGKPVAVVLSTDEFHRLTRASESLFDFIQRSPVQGVDTLEFERDLSPTRETTL
jgi:prevent-host-death family protein